MLDHFAWHPVHLSTIATRARLRRFHLRLNHRCHGRSTDAGTIHYDALTDDFAAGLHQLDLNHVTLFTHSAAAGEALRYAHHYGMQRLRRLILVGPTGPCKLANPTTQDRTEY